jgi:hypothetical protein
MLNIMTKGELMKLIFTEKELGNIDSAIPIELWDKIDTSIHVVDYNRGHGVLTNLITKAAERGVDLKHGERQASY